MTVKTNFNAVFDKSFFQLFYYSNSFVYDKFYLDGEIALKRVIFSNSYINKEYKYESVIGECRVERQVSPKWNYIKRISRDEISIEEFIKLFAIELEIPCNIKIFDPAKHGDWPGFNLHRTRCGSKTIITNPELEIPNDIYEFKKVDASVVDHDLLTDFFSNEFRIDYEKIHQLKRSCVFIFLYDNASILDWKIFQTAGNKKLEGVDVRLNIEPHLHPFPKLELKCELVSKDGNILLNKNVVLKTRYDIVHQFISDLEGEIYNCNFHLYEDGKLIDDCSGIPVRQIHVSVHPMGKKQ